MGLSVGPGDFAENLTVEGMELHTLLPGTRIAVGGEVILEISQIARPVTRVVPSSRRSQVHHAQGGVFATVVKEAKSGPVMR